MKQVKQSLIISMVISTIISGYLISQTEYWGPLSAFRNGDPMDPRPMTINIGADGKIKLQKFSNWLRMNRCANNLDSDWCYGMLSTPLAFGFKVWALHDSEESNYYFLLTHEEPIEPPSQNVALISPEIDAAVMDFITEYPGLLPGTNK